MVVQSQRQMRSAVALVETMNAELEGQLEMIRGELAHIAKRKSVLAAMPYPDHTAPRSVSVIEVDVCTRRIQSERGIAEAWQRSRAESRQAREEAENQASWLRKQLAGQVDQNGANSGSDEHDVLVQLRAEMVEAVGEVELAEEELHRAAIRTREAVEDTARQEAQRGTLSGLVELLQRDKLQRCALTFEEEPHAAVMTGLDDIAKDREMLSEALAAQHASLREKGRLSDELASLRDRIKEATKASLQPCGGSDVLQAMRNKAMELEADLEDAERGNQTYREEVKAQLGALDEAKSGRTGAEVALQQTIVQLEAQVNPNSRADAVKRKEEVESAKERCDRAVAELQVERGRWQVLESGLQQQSELLVQLHGALDERVEEIATNRRCVEFHQTRACEALDRREMLETEMVTMARAQREAVQRCSTVEEECAASQQGVQDARKVLETHLQSNSKGSSMPAFEAAVEQAKRTVQALSTANLEASEQLGELLGAARALTEATGKEEDRVAVLRKDLLAVEQQVMKQDGRVRDIQHELSEAEQQCLRKRTISSENAARLQELERKRDEIRQCRVRVHAAQIMQQRLRSQVGTGAPETINSALEAELQMSQSELVQLRSRLQHLQQQRDGQQNSWHLRAAVGAERRALDDAAAGLQESRAQVAQLSDQLESARARGEPAMARRKESVSDGGNFARAVRNQLSRLDARLTDAEQELGYS